MNPHRRTPCTAFEGSRLIASGDLEQVAQIVKKVADRGDKNLILIFHNLSGEPIDIDLRGTAADVVKRIAPAPEEAESPRGPGRPKLGVVAREITLLPRHWEWLGRQPGGASVALRKLVEEARKKNAERDRIRQSQDAAYRFMSAMAGNEPGFEEAARALYRRNRLLFLELSQPWPKDIKAHARKLAEAAFPQAS